MYSRSVLYVSALLFNNFMLFCSNVNILLYASPSVRSTNLLYVGLLRVDYTKLAALHSSGFKVNVLIEFSCGFICSALYVL